jgi:platelet-activating factor acetylhydrolase IB subunit alpha
MNAEFLKHKFTPEVRMNALKQLNEQGTNGMSNYYQSFIMTASRDKMIKLFTLQTGELLHTFMGHDNWVRCLSLHVNGRYLYSCSDDKTIRIWDMNFGK